MPKIICDWVSCYYNSGNSNYENTPYGDEDGICKYEGTIKLRECGDSTVSESLFCTAYQDEIQCKYETIDEENIKIVIDALDEVDYGIDRLNEFSKIFINSPTETDECEYKDSLILLSNNGNLDTNYIISVRDNYVVKSKDVYGDKIKAILDDSQYEVLIKEIDKIIEYYKSRGYNLAESSL